MAVEECETPLASAWPTSATGTIVIPGQDQAIVDYLSKRTIDGSVVTNMLVWFDDNQATAAEAAVEFLTVYPEIWETWVTPEAAKKIHKSLQ